MAHTVFIAGGTGYVGRHLVPALLARGHRVRLLVRRASERKVQSGPPECEVIVGDPFSRHSFVGAIPPADTFLQLVGVRHPSPSKAQQFIDIDLRSARESIEAGCSAAIDHFVYVSVAQPAPVMRAYQATRADAERRLVASGLRHTILRPWYVLGPGHWWPYALVPVYKVLEHVPAQRDSALRLGLVTIQQMVNALIEAVENPPAKSRLMEVPDIRQSRIKTAEAGRPVAREIADA